MAFKMKYKKGGFPFKESPLTAADPTLASASAHAATEGTTIPTAGQEGTFGKAMEQFAGGVSEGIVKQLDSNRRIVENLASKGGGGGSEGAMEIASVLAKKKKYK